MKKLAYLLYLSLLVFFSCQKDFYLEDLNEVNSQIEALQSQIVVSENEGKSFLSEKEILQTQIIDVQNQLKQQQMTLDEALEKIKELEEKIIEIDGIKDGIYEIVLEKQISTTEGEGLEVLESWWQTDPNTSTFVKIQAREIINHTIYRGYYVGKGSDGDELGWLHTRKLSSFPYYTDLSVIDTSDQNQNYLVNLSKERISLDSLLIIDKKRYRSHNLDDGSSAVFTDKVYTKLVERESFPPLNTEEELTEIFKNTGNGFYSDSLYLTLDPSDPYDYIRVFIEDAKRHGVDLSHITNKEPYLHEISIDSEGACAWASDVCDREKIWIEYDSACWEYGLPDPYFADRLQTMYHELGHTILSYDHPMVEDWEEKGLEWPENVAKGFNGRKDDIMGYSFNNNWEHDDDPEQTWYQRLDRFFKGIDHEYYDCTNYKGRRIIAD